MSVKRSDLHEQKWFLCIKIFLVLVYGWNSLSYQIQTIFSDKKQGETQTGNKNIVRGQPFWPSFPIIWAWAMDWIGFRVSNINSFKKKGVQEQPSTSALFHKWRESRLHTYLTKSQILTSPTFLYNWIYSIYFEQGFVLKPVVRR